MPIHISYRSIIRGMASHYKSGKIICRPMSDGSKICASTKAWQVFFAYCNKKGYDETKPMPRKMSLEDILELASEFITDNRNLW